MKKRILMTFAMLAASIFMFAGCAERGTYAPTPALTGVTRGVWSDNVWTSDYLGVSFNLPTGWTISSDADIAAAIGIGAAIIDAEEFLEKFEILHDMRAANLTTSESVQVVFERLNPFLIGISAAEVAKLAAAGSEMLGATAAFGFPEVKIGNHYWYQYETTIDLGFVAGSVRSFVSVQGDIVRMIMITYFGDDYVVADVLAGFSP
ncbi:MAG: hypothetical protein FWB74_08165 [Defluviitaleaceae bacterium]|nr:hypothetical protein [Defluviitaleaceae bacterium]